MYIGTPDNEAFVGPPRSLDELAQYMVTCKGPSGPNKDYIYGMAKAMRHLCPDAQDQHVWSLEALCRKYDPEQTQDLQVD